MSGWLPGLIFAAVLLWLLIRDSNHWEREEAKTRIVPSARAERKRGEPRR